MWRLVVKRTRRSNQLQFMFRHIHGLEVSIDQLNGHVKGVREEFEPIVHLIEPVDEHSSILWRGCA